jgi:toxin CptA
MPMLKISLRPSRILVAILVAAHGGVITVVAIVGMPLSLELIAITALAVNLVADLRRTALLLTPDSVVAIEIGSDDTLSIQTRRGNWISECEVLESTYVAAFLAIVNVREPEMGAVRHVVLLPDSIEAEDFRRLRVWLRWKRSALPA